MQTNKVTDGWPLQWPLGYARTQQPKRAPFKANQMGRNMKEIATEIRRLGGKDPIISTNIPLRADGLPYSDWERRKITDWGVAVYFDYEGQQTVLACDKWDRIEDNMRAVSLAIEAMRGIDRWGVSDMLKRAFMGFKALPAGSYEGTLTINNEPIERLLAPKGSINWALILGVKVDCTFDQLKAMYREKCRHCHPDTAEDGIGDKQLLAIMQKAYEAAKAERGFK